MIGSAVIYCEETYISLFHVYIHFAHILKFSFDFHEYGLHQCP